MTQPKKPHWESMHVCLWLPFNKEKLMWFHNNASTFVNVPASEFKAIMSNGWISPGSCNVWIKEIVWSTTSARTPSLHLGFALQHPARYSFYFLKKRLQKLGKTTFQIKASTCIHHSCQLWVLAHFSSSQLGLAMLAPRRLKEIPGGLN